MTKELYFIALISKALENEQPEKALKEVFKEIVELGQQPEYHNMYLQFIHFMSEIWEKQLQIELSDDEINELIRDLSLQMAGGLLDENRKEADAIMKLLSSNVEWLNEYKKWKHDLAKSETLDSFIELIVEKGDKTIGSIALDYQASHGKLGNITPGFYQIKLSTGRVLWEGELKAKDLIWAVAFPDQDFSLAADTGDLDLSPTKTLRLLSGEIILKVYAGLESGTIKAEAEVASFE
jgi:hypothetical protein